MNLNHEILNMTAGQATCRLLYHQTQSMFTESY